MTLLPKCKFPCWLIIQDIASADGSHGFRAPKGFTRPQFYRLENAIKKHPKTTFIGHGPAFWGNLAPDGLDVGYPSGPVKRGGLTQKLLDDYPNLYGGLDAASGIDALFRDPEFAKGFLAKHQDKLMFGSDCSCTDGRGAGRNNAPDPGINPTSGVSYGNDPLLAFLKGKCMARAQLTQLKQLASPDVFRKITWGNAMGLLKLNIAV
jgi:uncharacterized protein